ncbi:MAG: M42 family metallopeptidase [Chloroflexota bacterium]
MNSEQFDFLKKLVETTGPSGYESDAQSLWRSRLEGHSTALKTDALGNCTATLNEASHPRIMLDAHIDEIGFIVRYIDENGYLYWASIGGFDASTLPGTRVRIMGKQGPVLGVMGRKAVHLMDADERKKAPDLKKMWIDIGATSREEAESLVTVGDAGGRAHGLERMHGSLATANSFDDRIGVYIVAEVVRALADQPLSAAVFAVSSTQEEIGLRGARVAAYDIDATIGIAVDVTSTADYPGAVASEVGDLRVGRGPIVSRGANTNPRVFERLITCAEENGIPFQIEADPTGTGTNQNVMYLTRGGMATGLISIPTRYLHSSSEVLSFDDVDASVALLTKFVQSVDDSFDVTP